VDCNATNLSLIQRPDLPALSSGLPVLRQRLTPVHRGGDRHVKRRLRGEREGRDRYAARAADGMDRAPILRNRVRRMC